ncbi:MAG: iron chaperone [Candidatus Angelobacter sp.]
MKKAKSVKSSSATKTTAKKAAPKRPPKKTPPRTVDEYLARVPEPARNALTKIRAAIRSAVPPEATETISYRMPAFKHKRTLVWYAAFSNHCSLFPTAAVIEAFKDELKGFSTTKGTIHFPLDKPVPVALIKKLVKARVAESKASKRK